VSALIKFVVPEMWHLFKNWTRQRNPSFNLAVYSLSVRKFYSTVTHNRTIHIARILDKELNRRAVKYNHFELKNIAFDEKKFPMLF